MQSPQLKEILSIITSELPNLTQIQKLNQNQIFQKMCKNLQTSKHSNQKYLKLIISYKSIMEQSKQMMSIKIMEDILKSIVQIHSKINCIYPIPAQNYDLVDNLLKKQGTLSCQNIKIQSQSIKQPEYVMQESQTPHKQQQIDLQLDFQSIMAEQSGKNSYRNAMTFPNLQKQLQQLQNFTNFQIGQQSPQKQYQTPSLSHKPSSNKTLDIAQTSRLTYYEQSTLYHLTQIFQPIQLQMISKVYLEKVNELMSVKIDQLQSLKDQNQQYEKIYSQIIQELCIARACLKFKQKNDKDQYSEISSWLIIMIYLFEKFKQKYDPIRRKVLIDIFGNLGDGHIKYPYQVLRWLQNHQEQIIYYRDSQSYEQIINKASVITTYNAISLANDPHCTVNNPKMELVHISNKLIPRRKVINIWVSGFLSEDQVKKSQWKKLLKYMSDSQAYSIQWQSDTTVNLLKFMITTCRYLIFSHDTQAELQKRFTDNPFIPAFQRAQLSGKYLADLITILFPTQLINIAGYSLGAQLIRTFIQRMIQNNQQHRLNNIYLMGGVADRHQIKKLFKTSKYPLTLYNCHTGNDLVLKYLLSLCKPKISPIGLRQIPKCSGHTVINKDVSSKISGHLAYMQAFNKIGKILGMEKE